MTYTRGVAAYQRGSESCITPNAESNSQIILNSLGLITNHIVMHSGPVVIHAIITRMDYIHYTPRQKKTIIQLCNYIYSHLGMKRHIKNEVLTTAYHDIVVNLLTEVQTTTPCNNSHSFQ